MGKKNRGVFEAANFLMEATGIYYKGIAYHLDNFGYEVNVVLPNNSVQYFSSLNIKSKTYKIDDNVLSQMNNTLKIKLNIKLIN